MRIYLQIGIAVCAPAGLISKILEGASHGET